ncbi:MAG TPA: hypothetical protein VGJ28_08710 [Micromonosporaceae bacterium]|jgi:hypothetical protein
MNGRLYIDPWSPTYGSADASGGSEPGATSSAELDVDVEMPAADWHPLAVAPGVETPPVVLFADGVRRIDAHLWWEAEDKAYPDAVLAASYAAGVVRCDLSRGGAELVARKVGRGLFTAAEEPPTLGEPPACYVGYKAANGDPKVLENTMQQRMHELEMEVAAHARDDNEQLIIIDGPLKDHRQLPYALGYVKTHRSRYLPDRLSSVISGLHAGQRSPVFLVGTSWRRYSWYLRLPEPIGAGWSGIVRLECPSDLDAGEAIALAHLSAATLPRFASVPYKDPRAPHNLIPIAGLERRLRTMLGDSRLLHRALMRSLSSVGSRSSVGS